MSKRIEVNDLNVYYGQFKAVEDVSLTIEPRTVTAFIGPSGCGKSTFLRTLNRMHEVIPGAYVEGEVLIDGQPIRNFTLEDLRKNIGFVPQETFLFSDTIRQNIAFGTPGATDQQIEDAATTAHIARWV